MAAIVTAYMTSARVAAMVAILRHFDRLVIRSTDVRVTTWGRPPGDHLVDHPYFTYFHLFPPISIIFDHLRFFEDNHPAFQYTVEIGWE
jgi:hypothetical protein